MKTTMMKIKNKTKVRVIKCDVIWFFSNSQIKEKVTKKSQIDLIRSESYNYIDENKK
jgi:hypothetical protein